MAGNAAAACDQSTLITIDMKDEIRWHWLVCEMIGYMTDIHTYQHVKTFIGKIILQISKLCTYKNVMALVKCIDNCYVNKNTDAAKKVNQELKNTLDQFIDKNHHRIQICSLWEYNFGSIRPGYHHNIPI